MGRNINWEEASSMLQCWLSLSVEFNVVSSFLFFSLSYKYFSCTYPFLFKRRICCLISFTRLCRCFSLECFMFLHILIWNDLQWSWTRDYYLFKLLKQKVTFNMVYIWFIFKSFFFLNFGINLRNCLLQTTKLLKYLDFY